MKKSNYTIIFGALASMALVALAGCQQNSGGGSTPTGKFDFSVALASGSNNILYMERDPNNPDILVGRQDKLKITEKNAVAGTEYTYTISFSGSGFDDSDPVSNYISATFDAAEKADELSLPIIRSAAVKTEYKTDAGEYPNHLTLRITG